MSDAEVRITGLFYYPVKSCRGVALDAATLDRRGIVDDRRLMIIDEWGRFISQRSHPKLALVETRLHDEHLTLAAAGTTSLTIPVMRKGDTRTVVVWRDQCEAVEQASDASAWLSALVDAPVTLVRIDDRFKRPVDPQYAMTANDEVGFADAYPLLVISEESLADLNARLDEPLLMNRFRPNVVVRGGGAFAEDRWRRVRFGEVKAAVVKSCARCSTTTVDQETAARGKEPLRTLATFRTDSAHDVVFGQNVIHAAPGTMCVGDVVHIDRQAVS